MFTRSKQGINTVTADLQTSRLCKICGQPGSPRTVCICVLAQRNFFIFRNILVCFLFVCLVYWFVLTLFSLFVFYIINWLLVPPQFFAYGLYLRSWVGSLFYFQPYLCVFIALICVLNCFQLLEHFFQCPSSTQHLVSTVVILYPIKQGQQQQQQQQRNL